MKEEIPRKFLIGALLRCLHVGEGVVIKTKNGKHVIIYNELATIKALGSEDTGAFDNSGKTPTYEDGQHVNMNIIDDEEMKN
jgi:hypothetical protein